MVNTEQAIPPSQITSDVICVFDGSQGHSRACGCVCDTMAYDISFRRDVESAFETLDSEAVSRIQKKLDRVATDEFRSATEWGYSSWNGQSNGKYDWGSHRVFVDVDESAEEIVVYEARHRENLYR